MQRTSPKFICECQGYSVWEESRYADQRPIFPNSTPKTCAPQIRQFLDFDQSHWLVVHHNHVFTLQYDIWKHLCVSIREKKFSWLIRVWFRLVELVLTHSGLLTYYKEIQHLCWYCGLTAMHAKCVCLVEFKSLNLVCGNVFIFNISIPNTH